MFWLLYCGLFVLMLVGIIRMLNQRGKWAWTLFLGLLGSVVAYVLLFILPIASSEALHNNPALQISIVIGGTAIYITALFYGIRRIGKKLKSPN
jgi:drug/metabolite transporter (DMT)-like permease